MELFNKCPANYHHTGQRCSAFVVHNCSSLIVRTFVLTLLFLFSFGASPAAAQNNPSSLPLFHASGFSYEGAFRVPADHFGVSEMNYSEGPIEYNPAHNSIFLVGHAWQQAIAEFNVPTLVKSGTLAALNMAGSPRQVFSTVLDRAAGGNPQNIDRIGGMKYLAGRNGPELIVNAYEYYDAPGDDTHTTLAVRNANDIAGAQINGYFQFQGGQGHTSGWISPIPLAWQPVLGGAYITGQSSGIPIISRTSVGPSAFVFNPLDIVGNAAVPTPVPTVTLLDFSLNQPLHSDLSNESRSNHLWTHISRVVYGFIPPGTRTYVTIGYSGGHESGVCYKCTQSDGNTCGGYCAPDPSDYYHYYWLWDVNDLVAVKEGRMISSAVRPYEYGIFSTPFVTPQIGGGSFDSASGLLYLTIQRADTEQGEYANPPVIVGYRFNADQPRDSTPPAAPTALRVSGSPAPAPGH